MGANTGQARAEVQGTEIGSHERADGSSRRMAGGERPLTQPKSSRRAPPIQDWD